MEVVYVSAVEVGSEVREYYSRLLAMGPGGSETAMDRVHLLTPEHLHTFPSHSLPLSSLLALSPRLEHITSLVPRPSPPPSLPRSLSSPLEGLRTRLPHYMYTTLYTCMYCHRTVQRIKRLTAGREAYIVPGVVSRDDMTVADMLGRQLAHCHGDIPLIRTPCL